MSAIDPNAPAAPPQDGGPGVPANPVQPGSGLPTNDPATNPSAPVNAPNPEPGQPQAPNVDQPDEGLQALITEMEDGSPSSFLGSLFDDLDIAPAPAASAPAAPATPVQPQAANGAPAPVNAPAQPGAQPPTPPGVDAALLQQILNPTPQPPQPTGFQPPAAPQPATAPTAPAAGQPQPQQAPAAFVPFENAVELPPQILAALDNDDPNIRNGALGTIVAATGNETSKRLLGHINTNVVPQIMQAVISAVAQAQQQTRVMEDVFDGAPQLRFASPQLIDQCVNAVKQKALQGNPHAVWTRQMGKDAQALAVAALSAMAGGQVPSITPQASNLPPLPAPQPATAPSQPALQFITPPQLMGDGRWYAQLNTGQWQQVQPPVAAPQPPAQPAVPWMSGQAAGGFGLPAVPMPTPESELAAFHQQGGW